MWVLSSFCLPKELRRLRVCVCVWICVCVVGVYGGALNPPLPPSCLVLSRFVLPCLVLIFITNYIKQQV